MSVKAPIIVWFRSDLRLADNPALSGAIAEGAPIVPVFIHHERGEGCWPLGSASQWWLGHSLAALATQLEKRGASLLIRKGAPADQLPRLAGETGASAVFWNQVHEPCEQRWAEEVARALGRGGVRVATFNGAHLVEPGTLLNNSGKPYQVFTPFYKAWLSRVILRPPLAAPTTVLTPKTLQPDAASRGRIESLTGDPKAFEHPWTPGELGAAARLREFALNAAGAYSSGRDKMAEDGTSMLSPHLRFGEITPLQIMDALGKATTPEAALRSKFAQELAWREFAAHLLHAFPELPDRPMRPEFANFPYRPRTSQTDEWLDAWKRGATGYPVVDAGMRQLAATGWMHNRARMITASFLVKDLLLDWREGAKWFWETVLDADLANNTLGWQWVAGCGPDAAPYFRIFNPTLQGEKFDPEGKWVRRWVPELSRLPKKWIHRPWQAPAEVLRTAGVELGADYPHPIISHTIAREIALQAYNKIRSFQPQAANCEPRND